MTGETLGRRSLALDAVYCAVAGLIAIVAFDPLAELLGAPEALFVAVGAATMVWSLVVHRLARVADWRRPVVAVAAANVVAALGVAALALFTPRLAGQLLLAAVAIEVAAFAASQLVALRRAA